MQKWNDLSNFSVEVRNNKSDKRKLLLSCLFYLTLQLLSFSSRAQYEPILDTNKVWHASAFRMAFIEREEETYHLSDSVEIEGETYIVAFAETPASTGTFFHGFFREDTTAGQLFYRAALTTYPDDDTIYSPEISVLDLSLQVGQTYFQKYILIFFDDDIVFEIDSVEHLVVDAGTLGNRAFVELEVQDELVVGQQNNPWYSSIGADDDQMTSLVVNQKFIEGVGSSFGLFFLTREPWPFSYPQEPYVLCMSHSDSIVWTDPLVDSCQHPFDLLLSTKEQLTDGVKSYFYPNPATDEVNVMNLPIETTQISLLGMLGTPVIEKKLGRGVRNVSLNLTSINRGLYIIQIMSDEKMISAKRLIVTN